MARFRTPADLPGLKFWVEADLGLTQANNVVTAWNDQSGNANNLAPVGSPAWVPNVTKTFPGVQVVAASSQCLNKASTDLIGTGGYAMGVVMRVDATTGNDEYFGNEDVAAGGMMLTRSSGSNNYNVTHQGVAGQTAGTITNGVFSIHTFHGATGGNDVYMRDRVNVALGSQVKSRIAPGANGAIMMGARNNNNVFSLFASATFLAAFICANDVPHGYLEQVADWWKVKYGL
jgi:hypothetical protein